MNPSLLWKYFRPEKQLFEMFFLQSIRFDKPRLASLVGPSMEVNDNCCCCCCKDPRGLFSFSSIQIWSERLSNHSSSVSSYQDLVLFKVSLGIKTLTTAHYILRLDSTGRPSCKLCRFSLLNHLGNGLVNIHFEMKKYRFGPTSLQRQASRILIVVLKLSYWAVEPRA